MSVAGAPLFGLAAAFASERAVSDAVQAVRRRGFGRVDAYTPVPVPGLADAVGVTTGVLSPVSIGVAALGVAGCFGMCVYATMVSYDFIIGNRPDFSWPYFIIPSVSIGMLAGALAATLGMLFLCRLPRLNHPVFNIDGFDRATGDRFFLTIEAVDDSFDADAVERFLRALTPAPLDIQRVPR